MSDTRKLTIIATKGTLDWAYPPFILGSTAAALGMEVSIFFTFYGLNLLLKDTSVLKVTPMANPAMPMKMPVLSISASYAGFVVWRIRVLRSLGSVRGLLDENVQVGLHGGDACRQTFREYGATENGPPGKPTTT